MKKLLITLLLLLPVTSFASVTTGLVEYWPLDTRDFSSATNVLGRGGNADTGTLEGSPTPVIGHVGQALSFSGSNDVVFSGTTGTLNNVSAMSVAYWVKAGAQGSIADMVNKVEDYCSGAGWSAVSFGGELGFLYQMEGGTVYYFKNIQFNVFDSKWHYIAITYADPNIIHIYVDGVDEPLQDQSSGTVTDISSTVNIEIGNDKGLDGCNSPFVGTLDDVQLYNRVLTSAEVTKLYDSEAGIHPGSFWGTLLAALRI